MAFLRERVCVFLWENIVVSGSKLEVWRFNWPFNKAGFYGLEGHIQVKSPLSLV